MNFDSISNWRLLEGSHEFPGPDGGTCINEAAVVAAGMKYRSISTTSDFPPCFSRPISGFALLLNDAMPDYLRQELLLSFVTRLAGTADRKAVELQRTQFLAFGILKRLAPLVLDATDCSSLSPSFAGITTWHDAQCVISALSTRDSFWVSGKVRKVVLELIPYLTERDALKAPETLLVRSMSWLNILYSACLGTHFLLKFSSRFNRTNRLFASFASSEVWTRTLWTAAVALLDEAICMGNQAPPSDIALVSARLERAMKRAKARPEPVAA